MQQLNKAKSNDNFIGVPPDLTESSQKMPNHEEFDDEEDENEVQNNFLTQADLFRSYTDQNNLFINIANVAFWFEYGGRKIGTMNIDPI